LGNNHCLSRETRQALSVVNAHNLQGRHRFSNFGGNSRARAHTHTHTNTHTY